MASKMKKNSKMSKMSKAKKTTAKNAPKKVIKSKVKAKVKMDVKAKAKPVKAKMAKAKPTAKVVKMVKKAAPKVAPKMIKPAAKVEMKSKDAMAIVMAAKAPVRVPHKAKVIITPVKVMSQEIAPLKDKFKAGVKVVYPSHGVGEIKGIETQMIAGMELKTYVIEFDKEKMILRIPANRAEKSGLRALSSDSDLQTVRSTLLERPKSSRGMWSRRAKEYETKINSGNIIAVAEVVRDLHKNVEDPERSYSERVIYENALERLSREVSAIKRIDILASSEYLVKTINDSNPYFIRKAAVKKAAEEAEDSEIAA